ncbi:hypothetical protein GVN18_10000 [Pseudomonas sp. ODNR1LW]|jgi:RHS repeat-associated protein|nr:hypothetical protein [Pseudomonas sp. ODNR1LW]
MRSPANIHVTQVRTVLLATDNKNSVLVESAVGKANSIAYSAYGQQSARQEVATGLGFNGQMREAQIGWYLLGNGYRAYNPVLMRFHSPDSWSPFGEGGLNVYMYCGGEPVMGSDPTGHFNPLLKLLSRFNRRLTAAPSTSSLTPLIPAAADNLDLVGNVPTAKPRYENIPAIMDQAHTIYQKPAFPEVRTTIPRFKDTGGQAGIISPNWKPGEPERYRVIREPIQYAPVPPIRTLPNGGVRRYYVRYDDHGKPTQSSVQLADLSTLQRDLRDPKK